MSNKTDHEPKRPTRGTYHGVWYGDNYRAVKAFKDDWIKWARREIKRLRSRHERP